MLPRLLVPVLTDLRVTLHLPTAASGSPPLLFLTVLNNSVLKVVRMYSFNHRSASQVIIIIYL